MPAASQLPQRPAALAGQGEDLGPQIHAIPRRQRAAAVFTLARRYVELLDLRHLRPALAQLGRRIIGHLSKGYRQRVGLADALVHEPELIILDEPTIGLDPNQIRSVRQLIKDLGGAHTVLVSTHILPEAELTCNRVVIMFDGKILAADTPENLQNLMSSGSQVIAEIAVPPVELQECWAQMAEIEQFDVSPSDGEYSRCALTPRDGVDLRPQIYSLACERGWRLRELTRSRHSLEDIYVQVTRPGEEEG